MQIETGTGNELAGRQVRARLAGVHQISIKRATDKESATLWRFALTLIFVSAFCYLGAAPAQAQTFGCNPAMANPIVCENSKPGNPSSEWDVNGTGDPSIQGFATDISVNQGQTVHFKITTNATSYRLDIYRMGFYVGLGARKVATVSPSAPLPQNQPSCLTDATTGLTDCGNWAESASWVVPGNATSGIYFARLVRTATGGASHIFFVVRADASASDLLFQTSDTTWQAYNTYGGNSLYMGSPAGRAYKVSYNRPFTTRQGFPNGSLQSWVFNAEYPMVRWLEANGYNVSYFTGVDSDRSGSNILGHKVFLSVGHDEYWSGNQRANVEAARAAGVHLAFFSGNEVFWKTRWENSIDASNTPYRTLVCYKETTADQPIDPKDPPIWTGTWRDPRFSPPGDGGKPENALTGTLFMVNGTRTDSITVPSVYATLRFWRNTSVATLAPGATATLSSGVLGYEWDVVPDNGFRPAGLIQMSSTTLDVSGQYLLDYGSTFGAGTATHGLTLYRSGSALVFGAGTVQWSWGLDGNHDNGSSTPDPNVQQATINLFADMGVQPANLQPGLLFTSASTDTIPPTSRITSPSAGSSIPTGNPVTIAGTASDTGGGVVAGVEVSVDGGTTWHAAVGTTNWSYGWTPGALGSITLKSRAADDTGNVEVPAGGVTVTVIPDTTPPVISSVQASPVSNTWAIVTWATNKSSDSQVDYGTTTAYGTSTVIDPTMVASHSVPLNALTPSMLYHYRVKSRDAAGNLAVSPDFIFTTTANNSTQTITFDALAPNQPLNGPYPNGLIDWGTGVWMVSGPWGAFAGNSISLINGTITNGSFSFLVRMRLLSIDANNGGSGPTTITLSCPGQSSKQVTLVAGQLSTIGTGWTDACAPVTITSTNGWNTNFAKLVVDSPPATPPVISAVQVAAITCSTATISWTTDRQADSQVDYGATSAYGTSTPLNSTLVINHSVPLMGLASNTLYHYRVDSRDVWHTPAASGDFTFTTTPNTAPLPALSTVQAVANTNTSVYITWVTTTATDSQVDFGTTAAYGTSTPLNVTLMTSHSVLLSGLSPTTTYHYRVKSNDACGNPVVSGDFTFATTNVPPVTIWSSAVVPTVASASDASSVEVGIKFKSDTAGSIIGIRFYKGSANTGTHIGNLWTGTGTLLASGTFVNESGSGWQQVNFSAPVAIAANTTYVASYHTNVGGYAKDPNYFFTAGFDNPPLHALKDGTSGANGVYGYGASAFPTQTFQSTNYWVDVLFTTPPSAPPVISGVQAIAITNSSAYITWTTDQAADSQVDYGTTTAYGTTSFDPALVTSHSVLLTGLTANTPYHYRLKSKNTYGGLATSGDSTFATTNAPPNIIWSGAATPVVASVADAQAVELGVKFQSDLNGYIIGLRFYKGAANTGTHVGSLWTGTGTLLASATFVNESASGWQQVYFSAPAAITANTTYVASYHTNVGGYAADQNFFSSAGVDNAPLHALSNGASGGNGVYMYGAVSTLPTQTYLSTNYWVDVILAK